MKAVDATESRPLNFTLRPMRDTDLTDAIAITVENFTIDGNALGQYAAARVRERLLSGFYHHEHAPRFIVAVKEDGEIIGVAGWGKLEFASAPGVSFCPASTGTVAARAWEPRWFGSACAGLRNRPKQGRILVSTRHRKRFEKLGFRSVDCDEALSLHLMLKKFLL